MSINVSAVIEYYKNFGARGLFKRLIFELFSKEYRRKYNRIMKLGTLNSKFEAIYVDNLWRSDESRSGSGSEISQTVNIRTWLKNWIKQNPNCSIVDAPCGDLNWMKLVLSETKVEYLGCDIVDDLIKINSTKYGNEYIKFKKMNICEEELPSANLIIVRDCLFHLSFEDIDMFLKLLRNVDYEYLLTTTHIVDVDYKNSDIVSGDFRKIALFRTPFNFNENAVIDRFDDYVPTKSLPREMVLIRKSDVPASIAESVSECYKD